MIQDIAPHKYNVEFKACSPGKDDILLVFKENCVLVKRFGDEIAFPTVSEIKAKNEISFLFGIDGRPVFMTEAEDDVYSGMEFVAPETFRTAAPAWAAFAGITAVQLHRWYADNKFCSKCGAPLQKGSEERSLVCSACNKTIYPTISPCVIVAVTDKDRLLLTKYSPRHSKYTRFALVAGYNEIGETLEDTVRREVMEEVGLRVKNIRYFKNQPWSFTDTLLVGFFCDLDGSDKITRDENELSDAVWFRREDIPDTPSMISLTSTMIEHFRNNGPV